MSKPQRSSTSMDDFAGGCARLIVPVVGAWTLVCLALLWWAS